MNRSLALALILLLPGIVQADMALLPQRRPSVQITITIDRDHPDYEFLIVEHQTVERVAITGSEPLILTSENRDGHIYGVSVFAVPKANLAAAFGDGLPTKEWLERREHQKYFAGSLYERGRVDFTDNRDRIEKKYLLEILPDSCRLELVSENHGNKWVERGWAGLCCVLAPMAIIWLGFWLMGKLFLRRSR